MNKHTIDDLYQMQSLSLDAKIRMSMARIEGWIDEFGIDGVYVSFSGGKDSTVLMDIIRNKMGYNDIPALFVDVPTQYPELKKFAQTWDNVEVVHPSISFMEVCEKYGFPLISKEISQYIYEEKIYLSKNHDKPSVRSKKLNGELIDKTTGELSQYNVPQWKFLLDAPFSISHLCCNTMKKAPAKKYEKQTKRKPIMAQMADESRARKQKWIQNGCNAFNVKRPTSNPMSFWTEQDILTYIHTYRLPICCVYGDVVEDWKMSKDVAGQMSISDIKGFEEYKQFDGNKPPLKTTGCKRTGCMLCGFGCHLEKSPNRFEMLKETHPGMYRMLDVIKNNGITMREAIEWINEHGNMDIKL